jgi:hypothetical protein
MMKNCHLHIWFLTGQYIILSVEIDYLDIWSMRRLYGHSLKPVQPSFGLLFWYAINCILFCRIIFHNSFFSFISRWDSPNTRFSWLVVQSRRRFFFPRGRASCVSSPHLPAAFPCHSCMETRRNNPSHRALISKASAAFPQFHGK